MAPRPPWIATTQPRRTRMSMPPPIGHEGSRAGVRGQRWWRVDGISLENESPIPSGLVFPVHTLHGGPGLHHTAGATSPSQLVAVNLGWAAVSDSDSCPNSVKVTAKCR